MKIAMLGIGEAGRTIAADLMAVGVTVSGWDPEPKQIPPGVIFAASNAEAAQQADMLPVAAFGVLCLGQPLG